MQPVTKKQALVFLAIKDGIASGRCPSVREIAAQFGWAADNAAAHHIRALCRKGYLKREPGARGLTILKDIPQPIRDEVKRCTP